MNIQSQNNNEYPLIGKLVDLIGRPISIINTKTTGRSSSASVVEFACLTINKDGTYSGRDALVHPGHPIPVIASKAHGITDETVLHANELDHFIPFFTALWSDNIISGFNSSGYDIPVIGRNFVKYGYEPVIARLQLDTLDVWASHSQEKSMELPEVASRYSISVDTIRRAADDVIAITRLLEAMISQHGDDFVLRQLIFLEDNSRMTSVTFSRIAQIRKCILDYINQHGHIRPENYAEVAAQTNCSAATIEFQLSDMFYRGEINKEQAEDPDIQLLIKRHLDSAVAGEDLRLKAIKDALGRLTGRDIDYVQLRIALSDSHISSSSK